jgi:hypothetical protein
VLTIRRRDIAHSPGVRPSTQRSDGRPAVFRGAPASVEACLTAA